MNDQTATPEATEGTLIRISGEHGGRDITDEWVVEEVMRHGLYVRRVKDGKGACLQGDHLGRSNGPRFISVRKHCTVEVVG